MVFEKNLLIDEAQVRGIKKIKEKMPVVYIRDKRDCHWKAQWLSKEIIEDYKNLQQINFNENTLKITKI